MSHNFNLKMVVHINEPKVFSQLKIGVRFCFKRSYDWILVDRKLSPVDFLNSAVCVKIAEDKYFVNGHGVLSMGLYETNNVPLLVITFDEVDNLPKPSSYDAVLGSVHRK